MINKRNSIIEKIAPTSIVIPVVHSICLLLAFICIIKPSIYVMITIFFIETYYNDHWKGKLKNGNAKIIYHQKRLTPICWETWRNGCSLCGRVLDLAHP